VKNEVITETRKVAEVVEIDQTIVMSTVPPEQQAQGDRVKSSNGQLVK
jgi:hypothetical protein